MIRRPPRSTRTDTLFPYTTLFRAYCSPGAGLSTPKRSKSRAREALSPKIPAFSDIKFHGSTEALHLGQQHRIDDMHDAIRLVEVAGGHGRLVTACRGAQYLVAVHLGGQFLRSEERRVGEECVSTGRSRGSPGQ